MKKPSKRLFSNRELPSDYSDSSEYSGENGENTLPEGEYPSGKRHRHGNWPLTNTNANNAPPTKPRYSIDSRRSPPRRTNSEQARFSRFIEGSMNDRVSRKPPADYTGNDEELRETYDKCHTMNHKRSKSKKFTYHPNHSTTQSSTAQSTTTDASRQSSIFRFGKSLAATFNPTNWKIWSKEAEEESVFTDEQAKLRERQEKATRIYQELKSTGYFQDGAHSGVLQRGVVPAAIEVQEELARSANSTKHDSGIALGSDQKVQRRSSSVGLPRTRERIPLDEPSMSKAEKRMGRVFQDHEGLPRDAQGATTPKSVPRSARISETSSRKSFQFSRHSIRNIKKSFDRSSIAPEVALSDNGSLQRVPSRKDLQRQQKLVKKVSDLESKLEAARRQLSEVLAEPVPTQPIFKGRSRFVPGALATLPSERLLSGYVSNDSETSSPLAAKNQIESPSNIGRAITLGEILNTSAGLSAPDNLYATQQTIQDSDNPDVPATSMQMLPQLDKPLPDTDLFSKSPVVEQSEEPKQVAANKTTSRHTKTENAPSDSKITSSEPSTQIKEAKPLSQDIGLSRKPSKKRKSSFEGLADDGGQYKPSESSDEDYLEVKKKTPPKKKARRIPSTLDLKKAQDPNKSQHTARRQPAKKAASVMGSISDSKSKIPRKSIPTAQSVSPPPSSAFTGVNQGTADKSSVSQDEGVSRNVLKDDIGAYSATPGSASDEEVPPMPKLPSAFRAAASQVFAQPENIREKRTSRNMGRRDDLKSDDEEKQARGKKSFDWDNDVF
ncbi:hypothetical protein PVAG01_01061 [Phlyctema vagabunda]|uniref:Nuclear RNA binding protein n=1 Tax=Phlyctema vagabunda TaxID=108571 RepID=A0ABR4PWJ4_9HELO